SIMALMHSTLPTLTVDSFGTRSPKSNIRSSVFGTFNTIWRSSEIAYAPSRTRALAGWEADIKKDFGEAGQLSGSQRYVGVDVRRWIGGHVTSNPGHDKKKKKDADVYPRICWVHIPNDACNRSAQRQG